MDSCIPPTQSTRLNSSSKLRLFLELNKKNQEIKNKLTKEDLKDLMFSPLYLADGVNLMEAYYDNFNIEKILCDSDLRRQHMGILGSTGCGKTSFMVHMINQDIKAFRNVLVFDPKGDIKILNAMLQAAAEVGRLDEVLYINAIFPDYSLKVNLLKYYFIPDELVDHVVSGIKAKEEFFVNVASEVSTAIILALLTMAQSQNSNSEINFAVIKEKCDYNSLSELKESIEYLKNHPDPNIRHNAQALDVILGQILSSPQDFFAKISSTLRTVLTSLSTSTTGEIIGNAKTNEIVRRLENGERMIVYCNTGSLLTRRVAHIIARIMISMIQAAAGRKMSMGKTFDAPLCVYMDEGHNILYPGIQELFNKGRAAHVWLHFFTQSYAQIVKAVGREEAEAIRDNINTWLYMRIDHRETLNKIEEDSPSVASQSKHYSLADGHTVITTRESERKLILTGDINSLPNRWFVMRFPTGDLYKCRVPFVEDPILNIIPPETGSHTWINS